VLRSHLVSMARVSFEVMLRFYETFVSKVNVKAGGLVQHEKCNVTGFYYVASGFMSPQKTKTWFKERQEKKKCCY
jgi:hypothetical protein